MKLAVLYAGQGAQHPGMGKEFYEASPAFRAAFDSAALDFDLHRVCFEDPDGVLNQTEYTQPCMVAFACGVTAVLAEKGVKPAYLAGLSLGEYSALQAAGVFTAKQAIELTAFRGKAMAEAAKGLACGMTAVLGLDREKLSACCERAAAAGCVQICNYNCPGQLVIGGEKAAVEQAAALAKEAGARRCIPLKVSGPFHTKLMAPAGDALAQRFAPETPFWHRLLIGYDVTDELFGITIARPGSLNPYYTYGAILLAAPAWASGTALGIIAGNLLPLRVVSALSVALYGMFLAIIIPPARKDRIVAVLVVISFALSFLCSYLPGISALSEGTRTILLTVAISGAAAVLFPVRQEENEDDA